MKEPVIQVSDGTWKEIIACGVAIALVFLSIGGCSYWLRKGEALDNNTGVDHEQRDQTNKP